MVVIHEFGHFLVAKICGVRVEAFSFGFGPRLFGFKYGETDYKVCLLPLGGFVKMTGENPTEEEPVDDPAAFTSHPRWQRMLIGLAGPASNFILAFVLMGFYFAWINEVPDIKTTQIEWVTPGSVADQAGLHPGDIIRRFDNVDNPDWHTVVEGFRNSANRTISLSLERNGQTLPSSLPLTVSPKGKDDNLAHAGIFLEDVQSPIVVDQVVSDSPAQKAGLQVGDAILSADGHVFHTVTPLLDYLQTGKGRPVTLAVTRKGAAIAPIVVSPSMQDAAWRLGIMQAQPTEPPSRNQPISLSAAVAESRDFCVENSTMILEMVKKLVTHQASMKQLAGPVGIARVAGQAAETKEWAPKFGLAASISLNLGILNLMPFPILDGGLILLLLIESAIRRDISMIVKERIYQAAFVLLVAFFAFILFNDVTKLPIVIRMLKL
jgi:regulator of sigma E protease